MAYKTQRKSREERIKKAYFKYWQLQNNPDYIEWYKKHFTPNTPYLTDENKEEYQSILLPQLREKFKLGYVPVNPFKKINWFNFKKVLTEPDQEILVTFKTLQQTYGPIKTFFIRAGIPIISAENYEEISPFAIIINVKSFDKYEIIEAVSREIDEWKSAKKNYGLPRHRDSINKFHLYAQVWELRKGQGRKPYREIARMLGKKISTVQSMFYRAFELIFNQAFDPDLFRNFKSKVYKESLVNYCEICGERETCRDPCPDIIPYIMQDWKKRDYQEVQTYENNTKIKAHLGLSV